MSELKTDWVSLFGLQGKVAVVTGGSQGIGKAIARVLMEAGAHVVLVARRADVLDLAVAELACAVPVGSDRISACVADVSDEAQVQRLFDTVEQRCGRLDILVNCAGSTAKHPLLETSAAQWDESQRVNLRSVFLCLRDGAKLMQKGGQGGAIVNISSLSSERVTVFDNAHYGSAKAGVNMLTRNAAAELATEGIRVNAVLPGGVASEGARDLGASGYQPRGPMVQSGRFPAKRLANPVEIAAAVLYLVSPAAAYVNGQLLTVDGGFSVT